METFKEYAERLYNETPKWYRELKDGKIMKTINLHKFPTYDFDGDYLGEEDIYKGFTNAAYKNIQWEDLPLLESLRGKEDIELTEEMTAFLLKYLRHINPAIHYLSFEKYIKDEVIHQVGQPAQVQDPA